jgi:hypothetical protein
MKTLDIFARLKDVWDCWKTIKQHYGNLPLATIFGLIMGGAAMWLSSLRDTVANLWPLFFLSACIVLSYSLLFASDKLRDFIKSKKEYEEILKNDLEILPRHDAISIMDFSGIKRVCVYLNTINFSTHGVQIHSANLRLGNNIKTISKIESDPKIKSKTIQQINFDDEITQQQNDALLDETTINLTLQFLFNGSILEKPFTFYGVHIHRGKS